MMHWHARHRRERGRTWETWREGARRERRRTWGHHGWHAWRGCGRRRKHWLGICRGRPVHCRGADDLGGARGDGRGCSIGLAHERSVRRELCAKLILCERAVLNLRPLGLRLGDCARVEAEFNLLAPLVVGDVRRGDALHTKDLDFVAISARERVFDARKPVKGVN